MADLLTNFLDDILSASMGGKRRYKITRLDGSSEEVTIEDISKYDQVGSTFGAGDINKTNQAVNEKLDSGDVVDPMLTTEPGFAADAYHTKMQFAELNSNLENNILEEAISLNSYNSETNKYTFPSDGYLVLSSNTSKNAGFKLYGSNGNESGIRIAVTCFGTDQYGGQQVIFVKKGMMGFLSSSSSTSGAEFMPLV